MSTTRYQFRSVIIAMRFLEIGAAYFFISEARSHSMTWLGSGVVFFYAALSLKNGGVEDRLLSFGEYFYRRAIKKEHKEDGVGSEESATILGRTDELTADEKWSHTTSTFTSLLIMGHAAWAFVFH